MKSLWELVSGKRYRTNKVTGAASEEALARYSTLDAGKPAKAVYMALITVVPVVVAKIVEAPPKGASTDKGALATLAGYLSWLVPEMAFNADESLGERARLTREEVHRFGNDVYPNTDAVAKAVLRFRKNQDAFSKITDDVGLMGYTAERVNIINSLLGLPAVDKMFEDMYEITKYVLAIDRALEFGVGYFSKWLVYLRGNPSALK